MTRVCLIALLVCAACASSASAAVAPGRVLLPNGNPAPVSNVDSAGATAAVALPDGGAVVAGSLRDGGVRLVRLLANGASDPAFGAGGVATLGAGALPGGISVLLRRPDGRLLIAGTAQARSPAELAPIKLVQVMADGAPDRSFGRDGAVLTGIQSSCGGCSPVAFGPGGSILLAGNTGAARPPTNPAVVRGFTWVAGRLTAAGAPDPAFGGGDGLVTVPGVALEQSGGYAVQPTADGRMVLLGSSENATVLTALRADGAPDPTFGGGRVVPVGDPAFRMAVRADGAIDVIGFRRLARFTASGAPDPGFGSGGRVELGGAGGSEPLWRLLSTTSDDTLVYRAGSFAPVRTGAATLLVRRYGRDGRMRNALALSPGFGGGLAASSRARRLSADALRPLDSFAPAELLRRPDGSFLAVGGARIVRYTGEGDGFSSGFFAVAGYTPILTLDPAFGGPQAPARLIVRVARQRARTSARLGRVLVRATASGPGLALLRVRDGRRRILAETYEPVYAGGPVTVRIPLTATGRRLLRGGGLRVQAGSAFRDLLTARHRRTVVARLR